MPGYKRKRYGGYRKTYKRRRTYGKSALKKLAPSRSRRRNFTKAVKKLIISTAEKKRMDAFPFNYNFLLDGDGTAKIDNSVMSRPVGLVENFCFCAKGTNDGQRIGEQVRVVSAKLNLLVRCPIQNECIILKFWIGRRKEDPGSVPTAGQLTRLLDQGSSVQAYNGTILNHMFPNNTDEYTILHTREVRVGHAGASGFTNNDFPAFRKVVIDLTKHVGILKYSQLSSIPTNKHIYIWMSWINPDGTTPSVALPRVTMFMPVTYVDI